jgi:signal transduction histidine kinase
LATNGVPAARQKKPMKLDISLSRKTAIGFALALLALVIIGAISYRSIVQFGESADIVARSHQVITTLEATLGDLANAESEARGYIITGLDHYLDRYRRYVGEIEDDIKQLRSLAMDPGIQQRLPNLESLIRQRLAKLQTSVETRKMEGFEAVKKMAGPGKAVMDEVRQAVDDTEALENKLLAERRRFETSLAFRTTSVDILGSLFAVLVAAASTVILATDIKHRERLEKEVMEVSEREQRRIGQDLHDGLCQRLTGIALFSRSLQQKLTAMSLVEANEAAHVTDLINSSIEDARRLTRGLHPVPDDPLGLMMALRELVNNIQSLSDLVCRFDCPESVAIPDRTAATHLFRIAQEATQNAMRHAKAANIVISLSADENAIVLKVSDDGCGLPEHWSKKGLGLEIMDYRAHVIGATLMVKRGAERGTIMCCTLPRDAFSLEPAS